MPSRSLRKAFLHSWSFSWLAIAIACCPMSLSGQTFVSFDAPDAGIGKNQGTEPIGINGYGVITGDYIDSSNSSHGFIRSVDGVITEFDVPGLTNIGVSPANSSGQTVGSGDHDTRIRGTIEGFLRSPTGSISGFNPRGALLTFPAGINDNGEIAGTYLTPSSVYHGFILLSSGGTSKYTLFDEPNAASGPGQGTFVTGINANGKIVGLYDDTGIGAEHGFIRDHRGIFTSFDVPGAGTSRGLGTVPTSINPSGEVAGYYIDNNLVEHGFFRDAAGNITEFDPPGASQTYASSINEGGEIVGYWIDSKSLYSGFIRDASGNITSFSAPVPNTGTYLDGINGAGQMTGFYVDLSGAFHGFVQ